MFSLVKKKTGCVGVQITPLQIRMVELSGTLESPVVEHYWIEPLAADIYNGSEVLDQPKLGEAIKGAFQRGKFDRKNVAIALPSSLIISREFIITADSLVDPHETVEQEISAHVPLDIEDVYLDYQILDPVDDSKQAYHAAFAVSKKQHVDEYVGALEIAGLTAKVVDTDQNAMLHVVDAVSNYQYQGISSAILSVHIGYDHTYYMVFIEDKLVWHHDHSACMRNLQESISALYGLELKDSLAMALNPSAYAQEYPLLEADVIQPFIDGLAMDILRTIEAYNEQATVFGVSHLWLSGEGSLLPGLEDTVRARTGIEQSEIANPLGHCSLSSKVNATSLLEDAPLLMVATGMAMRSFPQ